MRVLLAARQGAIVARTKAIGQLKALIVNAPEALREQLRRRTTDQQTGKMLAAAHPAHTLARFSDREAALAFADSVRGNVENQARSGVRNISLDIVAVKATT
jgi:hypothetical protein